MFDKVIVKNISSLFGIKAASYIIPLITIPYLVRTLGVEGYGYLGFSLAIVQYFVLMVNYGFDLSATSSVAKANNNKIFISEIFWNIIFIRVVASFFGLCVIFVASFFIDSVFKLLPILLSCYITVIGVALFPQWLFQGKEQLGAISIARILLQFTTIPLLLFFVNNKNDVWQAALISSIPFLGIAIIGIYIIIKREWIDWVKPTWFGVKYQIIDGWHIFISTAAISLYTSSVTLVLGVISGPISVGYFSAADKLIKAAIGVYGTISNAFYPRINAEVEKDKSQAIKLIINVSKLLILIAILVSLSIFFMSNWVTEILFGPDFIITSDIIKILSCLPFVISLSNIFGILILIPFGYKKQFSRVLIISGLSSLVLLFPLVYLFSEYGAAISVLITEIIVTLFMGFSVKKIKFFDLDKK